MPTSTIRLELQDGLATVTLAQGERGNPFSDAFTRDFKQVFCDLWEVQGLRAVLLRAEGPNFSVGGDLKAFYPERDKLPAIVRRWTADLHMGLQRAWQLPVPIVCAVQGFVMGGGVGVMAGCDLVVAAESTRVGAAFPHIGFSCDSGTTATLTARMGAARARRFMLLGEMLTAADALAAGMVDKVVADDQLGQESLALARRMAAGPTVAYGEIKRLFLRAGMAQLQAQLEDEALTLARVAATADAQEGIAAMVEKRKPDFRGV